jgi:hypothetical protein
MALAAAPHGGQDRATEIEDPPQVRVDHRIVIVVDNRLERLDSLNTGDVYKDVDPAVSTLDVGDDTRDLVGTANIGRQHLDAALQAGRQVRELIEIVRRPCDADDRRPIVREGDRRRTSDPATGTGDENDALVESQGPFLNR